MLFSWLTEKGILAMNPARELKTEKFSRTEGKTPAFDTDQVQKVLDKIDTSNEVGLRDRALLGTLAYTFARIGAVVNLKVQDYFQTGKNDPIQRKGWQGDPRASQGLFRLLIMKIMEVTALCGYYMNGPDDTKWF